MVSLVTVAWRAPAAPVARGVALAAGWAALVAAGGAPTEPAAGSAPERLSTPHAAESDASRHTTPRPTVLLERATIVPRPVRCAERRLSPCTAISWRHPKDELLSSGG